MSTETKTDCAPCAHAAEHGSWVLSIPATYTHCRDCHATWPGSNKWGHCSACHRTFAGITAFDRHQRADVEGEVHPESMCSTSEPTVGKESILEPTVQPTFQVSASYTLEMRQAAWGSYWAAIKDSENPWAAAHAQAKESNE